MTRSTSLFANILISGVAIAALFSDWSRFAVQNPSPDIVKLSPAERTDVLTLEFGLFELERCQIPLYGGAIESANYMDCFIEEDFHAYYNSIDYVNNQSLLRTQIVVVAFAVIGTALAVFNALSSALALLNSAFAPSGELVKLAVSRSATLNLLSSASWLISWAVYTAFVAFARAALQNEDTFESVPASLVSANWNIEHFYLSGFALAVITFGLTLIFGLFNFATARVESADGVGSKVGSVLSWSVILSVATFFVTLASMVTPWVERRVGFQATNEVCDIEDDCVNDPNRLSTFLVDFSVERLGLYEYEDCSAEHWLAFKPESLNHEDHNFGNDCTVWTDVSKFVVEPEDAEATIEFDNYVHVTSAFTAASMATAFIGAVVMLAVATRAAAGDAAVATCNAFASPKSAFSISLLNLALLSVTWPVFATAVHAVLAKHMDFPERTVMALEEANLPGVVAGSFEHIWKFEPGFVLSIIAWILCFFNTVTLFGAVRSVGVELPFLDSVIGFFYSVLTHLPYAPAVVEKPALHSAPMAAIARIASFRSALIALIVLGASFAGLFGEWIHVEGLNGPFAEEEEHPIFVGDHTLFSQKDCTVLNWIIPGTPASQRHLECQNYLLNTYDVFSLPANAADIAQAVLRNSVAFAVLGSFCALVLTWSSVTAALTKPVTHIPAIVAAIFGAIFWPICFASSIKYHYDIQAVVDLVLALANLVHLVGPNAADTLLQEGYFSQSEYSYAFICSIVATAGSIYWLIDFFAFTSPALKLAQDDEKLPTTTEQKTVAA